MVDCRLPDRDWEGVKEAEIASRYCQFASNWGQITPGRQICWIYYLDLFDSLPALLLLLLYESVRWKSVSVKKENGFHNKDRKPTASHVVWWMSAELHKNVQKKKGNPLPLQCKHTEAKEQLFNWTITNDQQGLIDGFRILRASGNEALNSEVQMDGRFFG